MDRCELFGRTVDATEAADPQKRLVSQRPLGAALNSLSAGSPPRELTPKELATPNLLVIPEDEFRAIVQSVAQELRTERQTLNPPKA